jgi:hypothetical protein
LSGFSVREGEGGGDAAGSGWVWGSAGEDVREEFDAVDQAWAGAGEVAVRVDGPYLGVRRQLVQTSGKLVRRFYAEPAGRHDHHLGASQR